MRDALAHGPANRDVYAAQRAIEIVKTYADAGKSGLRLDGRDALKRLIEDVENGHPGFQNRSRTCRMISP